MITLTTEQAQQIEEAFENAESVAASINAGKRHVIKVDDEKCFWQREEWVRWAIDEVLPEIREALATIRAARAQEQAEQEPVAWVWLNEWLNDGYPEDCFSRVNHQNKTPLYAAPVRTKDLTDDEILKAFYSKNTGLINGIRAVIAKDRELNK